MKKEIVVPVYVCYAGINEKTIREDFEEQLAKLKAETVAEKSNVSMSAHVMQMLLNSDSAWSENELRICLHYRMGIENDTKAKTQANKGLRMALESLTEDKKILCIKVGKKVVYHRYG